MRALAVTIGVATLSVLVAGCGPSASPSPAPAPPPGEEPSALPTTAQPTPAPSPEPTPEPPPSTDPSPAPLPEADRFLTVERLDASAECDPLVPGRIPAPITVSVEPPPGSTGCGRGLSDGTGHVAALLASTPRGAEYQVFGPDGAAQQAFSLTGELWAEPEGWQGIRSTTSGPSSNADLLTFFPDGSPRRSEHPTASTFGPPSSVAAPDPTGGSLVVLWGPTSAGTTAPCSGQAHRYDATGAPVGSPGSTGCDAFAAGVSNAGEALVLEAVGTGARLRWLRADGTLARPTAEDSSRPLGRLVPLLDGSLVALEGTGYTRLYPHLGTASEPAPAWLAERGRQRFRFTRGNAGYAFFHAERKRIPCIQEVELLAPSGRRCVKLTFRWDMPSCVTGSIDQGWDGTVVEQLASSACKWRVWPGLLAGE
jgi:hypothetical protein